jgi:hypothetical protein
MKVVKIESIELIAENEFSKTFKYNDIELYLAKAFDEETNKHFLVVSIPHIQEVQAEKIQYPIEFPSQEHRDKAFIEFDLPYAKNFINEVIDFIKKQTEENKKNGK